MFIEPSSRDPVLDVLAKLQLSAPVGVSDRSVSKSSDEALWKSPKSAKDSKAESSMIPESPSPDAKLKGSDPFEAAESENGPKASYITE